MQRPLKCLHTAKCSRILQRADQRGLALANRAVTNSRLEGDWRGRDKRSVVALLVLSNGLYDAGDNQIRLHMLASIDFIALWERYYTPGRRCGLCST